jgi:hypothetical protein
MLGLLNLLNDIDQPSWTTCAYRVGPTRHLLLCDSGRTASEGGGGEAIEKPLALMSSTVPVRSAHTLVRYRSCSFGRNYPLINSFEAGKERKAFASFCLRLTLLPPRQLVLSPRSVAVVFQHVFDRIEEDVPSPSCLQCQGGAFSSCPPSL